MITTTIETDWPNDTPVTELEAFKDLRCSHNEELDLLNQECTVHYFHRPDWRDLHERGLLKEGCELRFMYDGELRIGMVEGIYYTQGWGDYTGIQMSMLVDGSWVIGEQDAEDKVRHRSFALDGILHVAIIDPYQD